MFGGARLGIALAERFTAPETVELLFVDPLQLAGTPDFALRSAGGFTGFGGPPALGGAVLRTGPVSAPQAGPLAIEGPSSAVPGPYPSPAPPRLASSSSR